MKKKQNIVSLLFLIVLSAFLNSCSLVYKNTGDIMIGFAEDQGVPYMMATDDVELGCSMAESFTPFLLSFSNVTTPPDQIAVLFYLMAGNCAEFKAWEEELRYLRAIHANKPVEAQDARIAQQRFLALAARRQLKGYYSLISAFVEPGGECPRFSSENEELYWLIGLINGVQAIINDVASNGSVGVPLDIASKVGRGATCLDNETWWGTPEAIQAAIWIAIPGNQPANQDPLLKMNHALQIGKEKAICLSQVLAAQVFMGQGKEDKVKEIIRNHAKLSFKTADSQEFKILNEVAKLQIQAISDRLWTQATGGRTPYGRLGYFWDDAEKNVDSIDIGDIL